MGYRSLRECVDDLSRTGQLIRIEEEIDPYLEAAEIQRRVYQAGGPAIYYARVKGCAFPMVSNLFGTIERARFIFRDTLDRVRRLIELKIDPASAMRRPISSLGLAPAVLSMAPKRVRSAAVLECKTRIQDLPQLVSWPKDGGPFITLPQVYTEHPDSPGWRQSNLGMYRVQMAGGDYDVNHEVGMHYQIHRGIGVHHSAAIARGKALRATIAVGGPPALAIAAVMPLPEGIPELSFAGALAGRRIGLATDQSGATLLADADFCITGAIDPLQQKLEGPFGDHLGYYAKAHPFPVLKVETVYHRKDAIWPFTVVGRPPQEDTTFGQLIHELTGPAIPAVLPGVKAVHAVDAAGVHPLLLAIGSERYTPYNERERPQELLTQANAILGQGQMSLAKYLWIAAHEDDPSLDLHDVGRFMRHVLERVDFTRDLHFQTRTTIDTLDYTGPRLNEGSKLVIAAVGRPKRTLSAELRGGFKLSSPFRDARVVMPGVLAIEGPKYEPADGVARSLCEQFERQDAMEGFPLVVLVDDAQFTAESLRNFLWVTFTRSNPAADIDGVGASVVEKHWGCRGPLVIDARIKPHHAEPLVEDPEVSRRVDRLAAPGGPLHGIL